MHRVQCLSMYIVKTDITGILGADKLAGEKFEQSARKLGFDETEKF